jgi:hypothetical protein
VVVDDTMRVQVALLTQKCEHLTSQMGEVGDLREEIAKLRVKVSELSTQIKITWALMVMLLGGIVSVAFSLWK